MACPEADFVGRKYTLFTCDSGFNFRCWAINKHPLLELRGIVKLDARQKGSTRSTY